jgi:tRNA pseudouridine38-40 synthase
VPRYVIHVRFKGTNYSGWQSQPNGTTVQDEVEAALTTLLRRPISIYGAGRTDAGVHALVMPAHFDYDEPLHPQFFPAMNGILPRDIAITDVFQATSDKFHARFDAVERAYRYQLIFKKNPLRNQLATYYKEKLNVEAMFEAAPIMMEFDSFESFCKSHANNKTFFCDIRASYFEWEDDMLVYHIRANRFLRGMVRTTIGTLTDIGKGKIDGDGLRKIIEGKDRTKAGPSLASDGLYLSEVIYPEGSLVKLEY